MAGYLQEPDDGHRHGGVADQERERRHRGAVRLGAAGVHVALPHRGRPGRGRARLLGPDAQALRLLHEARDEGPLRARLVVPRARLARGPQGRHGHGDLRAEHAPPGRHRPHPGATARHLLRHLHAARPARLRVPLARHHLREGHHRGRPDRGARGEPPPAPHLRRHAPARLGREPLRAERPGGARPPRALPFRHGPRHRRPRRRAGGGRLDDPARHRRHPQRRRPRPAGQARPRRSHRDDGRLRDGALRDGRGDQRAQGPDEGQDHLHLRDGLAGAVRLARRQRGRCSSSADGG